MNFKHKLMTAASTALVAAMLPINAFAAVQIDIYGDRRVYGKDTPFDTYVELESTGYGLINNTATSNLLWKTENLQLTVWEIIFPCISPIQKRIWKGTI